MYVWSKDPQISSRADGKSRPDYIPLSGYPQGLSPLSLLPRNLEPLDKAPKGIVRRSSDQSWGNLVHWWKQLCLDGKRRVEYEVVSNFEAVEAKPLPPCASAQLAELIALTQALELGKGKRVAICTDSSFGAGKRKKSSHLHWLKLWSWEKEKE